MEIPIWGPTHWFLGDDYLLGKHIENGQALKQIFNELCAHLLAKSKWSLICERETSRIQVLDNQGSRQFLKGSSLKYSGIKDRHHEVRDDIRIATRS